MTARSRPSPSRAQRVVLLATALVAAATAVGLWAARPRPAELPPVYREAVLEVTGLT